MSEQHQPSTSGTPEDLRLQILQLLKMRFDAPQGAKSSIVDLEELVAQLDLPKQEVRDHMTVLETRGYVKGAHSMGGDPNPGYLITDLGQSYVIEQR
jgi:DNA-binding IclR family transcriptional regulator